jgi:putative flavoprotein involved in K+ transport
MPSLPQRLLGRDLFWWLSRLGLMKANVDSRFGRRMAKRDVLIGSSKGRLRRAGVTLRSRLGRTEGRRAVFTGGDHVDVDAVVWATGYRPDFSWLDVPGVFDESGRILHRRGVTPAAGLTFLGLPWQYTRGSALLGFVKDDAAFIAESIAALEQERAAEMSVRSGPGLAPAASGLRPTSSDPR